MSSEARLYTFSQETKKALLNFRLKSSRVNAPQAVIYQINKSNYEIHQSEPAQIYNSLEDLEEDLPENVPRYVLLSHPIKTDDGVTKYPYVMIYYLPITCNNELRMMYAGAKELMRNTAEVQKIVDIEDSAEVLDVAAKHLGDKS